VDPALTVIPNLRLFLADAADVDLRDYEIYASHESRWARGVFRCFVIGASSIVVVETADVRIAEVIACGTEVPPRCLASLDLPRELNVLDRVQSFRGGCSYGAVLLALPLRHPAPAGPRANVLAHVFEGPGSPRTEICWELSDTGVEAHTLHEYPEAGVAVRSHSLWQF